MFPTGSKLLIGAAVAGDRRGDRLRHHPGWLARHRRADLRRGMRSPLLAGVNIYTRDGDVSAMDTAALTESAAAATRAAGQHLADRSARSAASSSSSGSSPTRRCSSSASSPLLAATVEWMVAGLERAGVGRPRATTPRCAAASPTRWSSRSSALVGVGHHRLLVQPDHAVPLEDERTGACSASSPRSSWSSVSSSPSGRRSAPGRSVAVSRRSPPSASSPAAPPQRSSASARCTPTRPPARWRPTASATTRPRPRPTSTPPRSVAAKANITAELTLHEDGTLDAPDPRRHRRAVDAVASPGPTRPTSCFRNESGEDRRLVLDLGTRPRVDEATGDTVPDDRGRRTSTARSSSRTAAASS